MRNGEIEKKKIVNLLEPWQLFIEDWSQSGLVAVH